MSKCIDFLSSHLLTRWAANNMLAFHVHASVCSSHFILISFLTNSPVTLHACSGSRSLVENPPYRNTRNPNILHRGFSWKYRERVRILALPMLRLLLSEAQGCKDV